MLTSITNYSPSETIPPSVPVSADDVQLRYLEIQNGMSGSFKELQKRVKFVADYISHLNKTQAHCFNHFTPHVRFIATNMTNLSYFDGNKCYSQSKWKGLFVGSLTHDFWGSIKTRFENSHTKIYQFTCNDSAYCAKYTKEPLLPNALVYQFPLCHPHIQVCYSHTKDESGEYEFVMDVAERDFSDLKRSISEMIPFIIQLVQGVVYLHDTCNLTHNDLKPTNLFLEVNNGKEKLVIGDFEFSSPFDETIGCRGTRPYLDPSLRLAQSKGLHETITASPLHDAFSLGAAIAKMVQIDTPYEAGLTSDWNETNYNTWCETKCGSLKEAHEPLFQMITGLCHPDEEKRLTAAGALKLLAPYMN